MRTTWLIVLCHHPCWLSVARIGEFGWCLSVLGRCLCTYCFAHSTAARRPGDFSKSNVTCFIISLFGFHHCVGHRLTVWFPTWTFFFGGLFAFECREHWVGLRWGVILSLASSIFPELPDNFVKVWGVGWVGPSMIGPIVWPSGCKVFSWRSWRTFHKTCPSSWRVFQRWLPHGPCAPCQSWPKNTPWVWIGSLHWTDCFQPFRVSFLSSYSKCNQRSFVFDGWLLSLEAAESSASTLPEITADTADTEAVNIAFV